MLHPNIQKAVDVLREEVTDGHRLVARGTDDLIVAAAEELSHLKARVAEVEKLLRTSVETNSNLIAQLADKSGKDET